MEEILRQLIGSLSHYLQGFFTYHVVQDFFHQQYGNAKHAESLKTSNPQIARRLNDQLRPATSWSKSRRYTHTFPLP